MTKIDIIKHLEDNYGKDWIFGGRLAREIHELTGTKESVVERRCRELENAGILEKQLVQIEGQGARVVQYRIIERIPTMAEVGYIPKKYREEPDTRCGKFHNNAEESCIECRIISLGL